MNKTIINNKTNSTLEINITDNNKIENNITDNNKIENNTTHNSLGDQVKREMFNKQNKDIAQIKNAFECIVLINNETHKSHRFNPFSDVKDFAIKIISAFSKQEDWDINFVVKDNRKENE